MNNKNDIYDKHYIRTKDRINEYKQIEKISDGEKKLIQSIQDLRSEIKNILLNYLEIDLNLTDNEYSLSILYMSNSNHLYHLDTFLYKLISYRLFYESTFSNGKNSTYGRNPILQMLLEDFLNTFNIFISRESWKDTSIYDQFRGFSNRIDKWHYVAENINQLTVESENVLLSLSCIDNINDASEMLFNEIPLTNDFFYVCVNTHKDYDDIIRRGYISNYNEELKSLNNFFRRYNLRHLTVFNPSRKNYLLLLDTYKPNRHHYIGHGTRGETSKKEKDYLMFRSKSKITSADISSAYSTSIGQFMFINCCESILISQELKDSCFENTVGYNLILDNKEAAYFAEEFYRLMNPRGFNVHFLSNFELAKRNLKSQSLQGFYGQILDFDGYTAYQK
jgi:hypothetical protein